MNINPSISAPTGTPTAQQAAAPPPTHAPLAAPWKESDKDLFKYLSSKPVEATDVATFTTFSFPDRVHALARITKLMWHFNRTGLPAIGYFVAAILAFAFAQMSLDKTDLTDMTQIYIQCGTILLVAFLALLVFIASRRSAQSEAHLTAWKAAMEDAHKSVV